MQILQTPRLILRQFTPADADPLAQVLGDLETMLYYPEPYDRAGVEQWITRNLQRYRNRRRLAETGCRVKHPSTIFSIGTSTSLTYSSISSDFSRFSMLSLTLFSWPDSV